MHANKTCSAGDQDLHHDRPPCTERSVLPVSAEAKEPLHKPHADRVAGEIGMIARSATKVVAWTTMPGSATSERPISPQPAWDGAFRAVCDVARLADMSNYSLRLAPCIPSRKASIATVR